MLARAYLAARDYQGAGRVIAGGLALDPDDQLLLETGGEMRAATGEPEGALADWRVGRGNSDSRCDQAFRTIRPCSSCSG